LSARQADCDHVEDRHHDEYHEELDERESILSSRHPADGIGSSYHPLE